MNYKLLLASCLLTTVGFSAQSVQASTAVTGSIATTTWTVANSPYYITARATVERGNTLTIEPGVIVKFDDGASLTVAGNLVADGTADDAIVFTSLKDDSYGGDTNGDGTATSPTFQDWNGVVFAWQRVAPTGQFDYVTMQYGGGEENSGMLALNSGNITISHSTFRYSAYASVYAYEPTNLAIDHTEFDVTGSSGAYTMVGVGTVSTSSFIGGELDASEMVAVTDNTFTGADYAISLISASTVVTGNRITGNSNGIYWLGTTGTPTITGNAIYNNSSYGFTNFSASYEVPIEDNWWGDVSGPYHETLNSSGLGDRIYGNVDFDPWLTADPTLDATAPAAVTLGDSTKDPWNKTITLNWTNPTDEDFDHVQIDRMAADGTVMTLTTTEEGITYLDSTVEYDTYYTYTFYSIDTAGNTSTGVSSVEQRVRSPQVKHLRLETRDRVILTQWSRLPLRSTAGYLIYYGTAPDALTSVIDVGQNVRKILGDLRPGRTYYVAVAAYSRAGVEGPQAPIQSITL